MALPVTLLNNVDSPVSTSFAGNAVSLRNNNVTGPNWRFEDLLNPMSRHDMICPMNRAMIIGCGGSGKSTFARRLGEVTDLPVHHLDRLFWRPGWTAPPKDEWRAVQVELCARPQWIIDGNYGSTMDLRLAACDTVIFLDLPTWTCLYRVLKRTITHWGRSRPDLTEGCPERFDWPFTKWILTYRRTRRPRILGRLNELNPDQTVVILSSQREIDDFVAECLNTAQPSL